MKIYYSLCGEGLGHATRALALSKELPYDFTFFTYGKAADLLRANDKEVIEIKGLKFAYSNNKINTYKTVLGALEFCLKEKTKFHGVPDLCISDWEPTLYKFARQIDVPLIEVASQFKFRFRNQKVNNPYIYLISLMTRFYGADEYIVPSFQFEYVATKDRPKVTPVFGFTSLKKKSSDHLLIYTNSEALTNKILMDFKNDYKSSNIVIFDPTSKIPAREFHSYLVHADRVASTAGTQLVSECASMGIPINIYPIKNQPEQTINCDDAVSLGIAHSGYSMTQCDKKYVGLDGTQQAVEIIKKYENKKPVYL